MNGGARACEVCGSTDGVTRQWIAEHDESGTLTGWMAGLLCAVCATHQEQPPEFINDAEMFAQLDMAETARTIPPRAQLPEPRTGLGFKALTLENWQQPDPVSSGYVTFDSGDQPRPMTGDDWMYHILAIPLAETVPDELRRLFEVARGTMLYGWFFYPAYTLASEQVLRVAEAAVARRCQELEAPRSVRTLGRRLAWLGQRGDLSAEDLERWDAVRHLRNLASHPQDQNVLLPGMVISQVRLLADAIGSLFEPVVAPVSDQSRSDA